MSDIVRSSEGTLDDARREVRRLLSLLTECEGERDRARAQAAHTEEHTRQLQAAAQFSEASLIVADGVVDRARVRVCAYCVCVRVFLRACIVSA